MFNELCNYINCLFKNITNYQDVLMALEKLEVYLLKNNIKLDTSLAIKLFKDSDSLLESFDLLYNYYQNNIDEKKINTISSNYTALFLLKTYCILNDIIDDINNIDENHLLTHEEEIILIKRIKKNDKFAQEKFIKCNLPLVKKVARKFNTTRMEYDDLIQEGCLGLMHAIDLYDENLGNKFSTYAIPWIYNSISRAVYTKERMIKLPVSMMEEIRKYVNLKDDLSIKLNRESTDEEIAQEMNLNVLEIKKIKSILLDTLSLDYPLFKNRDTSYGETIIDDNINLEDEFIHNDLINEIRRLIDSCNFDDDELMILRLRFGFDGYRKHSLSEIAKILNVHREVVRQKEIRILKKLIYNENIDYLMIYLDNPANAADNLSFLRKSYVRRKNNIKSINILLKNKDTQK